jgi:hypothetical protein
MPKKTKTSKKIKSLSLGNPLFFNKPTDYLFTDSADEKEHNVLLSRLGNKFKRVYHEDLFQSLFDSILERLAFRFQTFVPEEYRRVNDIGYHMFESQWNR